MGIYALGPFREGRTPGAVRMPDAVAEAQSTALSYQEVEVAFGGSGASTCERTTREDAASSHTACALGGRCAAPSWPVGVP